MTVDEGAPRAQSQERPRFRKYGGRRKVCRVCYKGSCVGDSYKVDYKDVGKLRMFVSDRGKIEPRRKTGSCARAQRAVATAVKRARHLALLPYTLEHLSTSRVFPTRR